MVAAPRQALVAEVEASRRLQTRAKSSAAVGRRLIEQGSDWDVCALAQVGIGASGRLARGSVL